MSKVVVLGASSNPERYSFKAVQFLLEKSHQPIPVHPKEKLVQNIPVLSDLSQVNDKDIHTISVYVNPDISNQLIGQMLKIKPKRVIFNPGSENPSLYSELKDNNIEVIEACTLVMLRANTF